MTLSTGNRRLEAIFYSGLPCRQPRKKIYLNNLRNGCALPHRQPRNQSVLDGRASDSDLPYRQSRIGQEESNLPAEQAVNNQNHQV